MCGTNIVHILQRLIKDQYKQIVIVARAQSCKIIRINDKAGQRCGPCVDCVDKAIDTVICVT